MKLNFVIIESSVKFSYIIKKEVVNKQPLLNNFKKITENIYSNNIRIKSLYQYSAKTYMHNF